MVNNINCGLHLLFFQQVTSIAASNQVYVQAAALKDNVKNVSEKIKIEE